MAKKPPSISEILRGLNFMASPPRLRQAMKTNISLRDVEKLKTEALQRLLQNADEIGDPGLRSAMGEATERYPRLSSHLAGVRVKEGPRMVNVEPYSREHADLFGQLGILQVRPEALSQGSAGDAVREGLSQVVKALKTSSRVPTTHPTDFLAKSSQIAPQPFPRAPVRAGSAPAPKVRPQAPAPAPQPSEGRMAELLEKFGGRKTEGEKFQAMPQMTSRLPKGGHKPSAWMAAPELADDFGGKTVFLGTRGGVVTAILDTGQELSLSPSDARDLLVKLERLRPGFKMTDFVK